MPDTISAKEIKKNVSFLERYVGFKQCKKNAHTDFDVFTNYCV